MFRLIRTFILLMIAFVTGLLFERFNARDACGLADGVWKNGICIGSEL